MSCSQQFAKWDGGKKSIHWKRYFWQRPEKILTSCSTVQKEIQVWRKETQVWRKETVDKIRNWQVEFSDKKGWHWKPSPDATGLCPWPTPQPLLSSTTSATASERRAISSLKLQFYGPSTVHNPPDLLKANNFCAAKFSNWQFCAEEWPKMP